MVSVAFFLLAYPLLNTSTMHIARRTFWQLVIYGMLAFFLLSDVIWKYRKVGTMETTTTTLKAFKFEIKFYESLGFQLTYDKAELLGTSTPADSQWTYEADLVHSFMFEAILFGLMLVGIIQTLRTRSMYNYLTHPEIVQDLSDLQEYQERLAREQEEDAKKEPSLAIVKNVQDAEADALAAKEEAEKFESVQKKVKKSFLDSDNFYKNNRIFFITLILFELFQAMVFNSCSDIPTLFMLLLVFAMYAFRKDYTVAFLQYTFFVVYFIQFMLTLKLINNTLTSIDFVKDWMEENKEKPGVQFNNILFGNEATPASGESAAKLKLSLIHI